MGINLDKPNRWKADIAKSVDMYNEWFMKFAPEAFRTTRIQTTADVEAALHSTENMAGIVSPGIHRKNALQPPAFVLTWDAVMQKAGDRFALSLTNLRQPWRTSISPCIQPHFLNEQLIVIQS